MLLVAEEKSAVRVEADNVVHDEATGKVTYSGNVVVIRGEMQLLSDTLVITRDSNTGQGIITATGDPLKFLSNSEGQRVSGDASTATYQVNSKQLELRGSPMHFESVDARGQKLNGSASEARYDMEASFLTMSGAPVRFRQTPVGDDQPIMGTSSQADYDMNRKLLVLSGDATVQQDGNTVRNDRIVFNLKESVITAGARANARERVETLLELE
jgi:lipopolysaccharide export system protein LptA